MNEKTRPARMDGATTGVRDGLVAEPASVQAATVLLMTASVIAQGLLIGQLLDHAAMPPGEQRGWAGMGLMVMVVGALVVVVPGTVAAIYRFTLAWRRHGHTGDAQWSIAVNGAVMLMPLAVWLALSHADAPRGPDAALAPRPSAAPPAAAPRDESTAGFRWANSQWIDDPEACSTGSASFREGCRRYARDCRTLPCEYRAPSGETVAIFARPSPRAEPARAQ